MAELKAAPDDAGLKILLAKVFLAKNDTGAAKALLTEVVDGGHKSIESYMILTQLFEKENDISSAKETLLKGKSNVASNYKIILRLAAMYEVENEYQKAIEEYDALLENYPDNLIVINNLASLLSDHGKHDNDLNRAKVLADRLKESGQPVFFDTIGWVSYKLGDYDDAINHITKAVEKAPNINIFNYHLGMAYKMSGDKQNAKTYLEKSLSDNNNFKEKKQAEAALNNL
jgi:tetratricopeptide (TPR) repeat protein